MTYQVGQHVVFTGYKTTYTPSNPQVGAVLLIKQVSEVAYYPVEASPLGGVDEGECFCFNPDEIAPLVLSNISLEDYL